MEAKNDCQNPPTMTAAEKGPKDLLKMDFGAKKFVGEEKPEKFADGKASGTANRTKTSAGVERLKDAMNGALNHIYYGKWRKLRGLLGGDFDLAGPEPVWLLGRKYQPEYNEGFFFFF